jgi:Asp/Glu/hydantoin racemase
MTGPEAAPPSINDQETLDQSAEATLPGVVKIANQYKGILIACYSSHPLVSLLRKFVSVPVVGIFEASVCTALLLVKPGEQWGIVSTGKIWEQLLSEGTSEFLGLKSADEGKFAGVETTGLSATELHDKPEEEVTKSMIAATRRLVSRSNGKKVGVVCLGCAGMVGMDKTVRKACIEELGDEEGNQVRIIDGVKAGLGMVEGMILAGL